MESASIMARPRARVLPQGDERLQPKQLVTPHESTESNSNHTSQTTTTTESNPNSLNQRVTDWNFRIGKKLL